MVAVVPDTNDKQQLRCMEIWGGNGAINSALAVSGLDAWVFCAPYGGEPRGGDIHYVSTCGAGKIARFAVADVAGHGAAVSDMGTSLRRLMRNHINQLDQTRFIRALNREFEAISSNGIFATAVLASYFAPASDLIVCNAGHPPPLWYRAARNEWTFLDADLSERLEVAHNLPLGIIEQTDYRQFAVHLERNDLVVMYTDWLIEAASPSGELLGEQGLLEVVRRLDAGAPADFVNALLKAVSDYRGGKPAADDVTLLLLHHNGAPAPRPSAGDMIRTLGKVCRLIRV